MEKVAMPARRLRHVNNNNNNKVNEVKVIAKQTTKS